MGSPTSSAKWHLELLEEVTYYLEPQGRPVLLPQSRANCCPILEHHRWICQLPVATSCSTLELCILADGYQHGTPGPPRAWPCGTKQNLKVLTEANFHTKGDHTSVRRCRKYVGHLGSLLPTSPAPEALRTFDWTKKDGVHSAYCILIE